MSNKITGKEYPLSKIFSSDFEYHIPGYQRPYCQMHQKKVKNTYWLEEAVMRKAIR